MIYDIKQIDSQRGIMLKFHWIATSAILCSLLRSVQELFQPIYQQKKKPLSAVEGEKEGQGRQFAETQCFEALGQLVLMIIWPARTGFFLMLCLAQILPTTSQVLCSEAACEEGLIWAWGLLGGREGFANLSNTLVCLGIRAVLKPLGWVLHTQAPYCCIRRQYKYVEQTRTMWYSI